MPSDHIILTMTTDTTVAFVTPFEKERCKSTVSLSGSYVKKSNLVSSLPVMLREERLWNFSVFQSVHLSSLRNNEGQWGIQIHLHEIQVQVGMK
jgi:hypothetical protein